MKRILKILVGCEESQYEGDDLVVRAIQEKKRDQILSIYEIVSKTKHMFALVPRLKVKVHPVQFMESPVEIVTADWIKNEMNAKKVKLKDIVSDSGIDKTSLSAIINGHTNLSQPMMAFFYYYFKLKEL